MRTWLHQGLSGHAPVIALLAEGAGSVFQHRSIVRDGVPKLKPFLSHRLGMEQPEIKDDGITVTASVLGQVWVHDDPGDYMAIDAVLKEVEGFFEHAAGTAGNSLIRAEWLETSEDFADPEMGTILRWCRFRLIYKP